MSHTYSQATAKPTAKVAATGIAGSIAIVLIWVAGLAGIDMPAEVAAAITAIIAFGAGYMKKSES
ncbi:MULTISPECIES: hypothetical protein [Rhodococcus]|uniref:hypothetical protein n=1 Tax=Rhodococcus TaxID=1827 RepID=UPI000AEF6402|nr:MULTISPECIES: hypothetical protein [Rhodococcus]